MHYNPYSSLVTTLWHYRAYNCLNDVVNRISYAGPEMVIRCCLKFIKIPPDFRLIGRKQVYANIEHERNKLQDQTTNQPTTDNTTNPPTNTNNTTASSQHPAIQTQQTGLPQCNQDSQPRPFAVAKTDFTNFYFWFPSRTPYHMTL